MKHHISIDTDGQVANTKNVHITVSEQLLIDESYPTRNVAGEVALKRHRIQYADSTGNQKDYIVREIFPDETVGMITCILGDYE